MRAAQMSRTGATTTSSMIAGKVCFQEATELISTAGMLKGFGCREAYESLSCRNPRATRGGYGDFGFRLMSGIVRPPSGSAGIDADGPLRPSTARCFRLGGTKLATLSILMITMGARGSVAGG